MNILLGITGSIAAYKSLELVRLLRKEGASVKIILTKSGAYFVTPLSCQTLSANEVYQDQFILTNGIKHLTLSEWADILTIAPATANIIGKAASGIGDDLLSTTILSFAKPILFIPAMDEGMWQSRIVQKNVKGLKDAGHHIMEPSSGPLASGKIGKGRFPEVKLIYKKILTVFKKYKSLKGKKFLITGGRTEEDLDSVRTITNRSTGRMAKELLDAVICRDGVVRSIMGEVSITPPSGIEISRVRTSAQMLHHLKKNIDWCDCLVMASAVGDYKPRVKSSTKIHSKNVRLELKKNRDLLREVSKNKKTKVFVGFSLEDKETLKRAEKKLKSKNLDIIVLNSSHAIGNNDIVAHILKKNGRTIRLGNMSKWDLANKILDECLIALQPKKAARKK